MTFHVSLASTHIVNLYLGKASDAADHEADWLQPTTDTAVSYTHLDVYKRQDDFFNYMRNAGYTDVERGERGSTEEHLTVTQFKVQRERCV